MEFLAITSTTLLCALSLVEETPETWLLQLDISIIAFHNLSSIHLQVHEYSHE